jgi:hypothetical protein
VIVTGKANNLVATGCCPGDAYGEEIHLGSAHTHADTLDPWQDVDEGLGELGLEQILAGEELAGRQRLLNGFAHRRMTMTEDHGAHARRIVDVHIVVDIPQQRTIAAGDSERHGCASQAHIRIHATGDHGLAPVVLYSTLLVTKVVRRCHQLLSQSSVIEDRLSMARIVPSIAISVPALGICVDISGGGGESSGASIPTGVVEQLIRVFVEQHPASMVTVWELTPQAALDMVPRSETQVSLSRARGVVQGCEQLAKCC